jgi:hypothetical protein
VKAHGCRLTLLNAERERRERKLGDNEEHYICGGKETISPVLKVPRQCPLALLVEVMRVTGINFL